MKKTLTAAALILATASSAAFAQGMEGHQIGYNDKIATDVSYSSRNLDAQDVTVERDVFQRGQFRADADEIQVITVFPTLDGNRTDGQQVR